tara:strand:- start:822 stop:1718 length:897 start_codon:yes stop_codon:yes gene_type:complete
MKKEAKNLSEKEIESAVGTIDSADLESIRDGLRGETIDLEVDGRIDGLMKMANDVSLVDESDIPPLPSDVRDFFEEQREFTEVEVRKEEKKLNETVFTKPRRQALPAKEKVSWFPRLALPVGLAAAAVITVAVASKSIFPGSPNVAFAGSVSLLTPGDLTGYAKPTFTWETDNGGVVGLTVKDQASGETVVSLEKAYSPIRFEALKGSGALKPGSQYLVELTSGEQSLAVRPFETLEDSSGAPKPQKTLGGIIGQCKKLIAENRSADAWMLWGELTSQQKQDPRMQALKDQIRGELTS